MVRIFILIAMMFTQILETLEAVAAERQALEEENDYNKNQI